MIIQLKQLILTNFKGIKSFTISFDGDTNIYGANEVGKSTIYTAFCWLLTGKDEFDRKDFEIKNTKEKELNTHAHEVEGIFTVDGIELKLKRTYLEKWEKPRGQAAKVFKGHTTDYFYNDVPCNMSEYQSKVDELIDSKVIKMVTNPNYFNGLKPEDQRRGLLAIAGEISAEDVINAITTPDNDFSNLINALNSRKYKDISEYKKELSAKKNLLKKTAIEYRPRIDEAKRSMPEDKNWQELETDAESIKAQIIDIDQLLTDASKSLAESQKHLLDKQKLLHTKKTSLANIRYSIESELRQNQNEGASKIGAIQSKIKECNVRINQLKKADVDKETNKAVYQKLIDEKNETITRFRKEWDLINSEKFEFDDSKCECPTCKQQLPAHDIESQKSELLKNFNASVASRKADKVKLSDQVKAEIKQLQENLNNIDSIDNTSAIALEETNIQNLNYELSELQSAESKKGISNIEVAAEALLKVNADALNLQDEITALEDQISKAESTPDNSNDHHKQKKQELQSRLNEVNKELSTKHLIEKSKERIQQLEKEEQVNAQAIATIEQQEFEIETFVRAKMDILESRVNQMFEYVKFRLFEIQVDGGIAETCVCEYKGVPYPTLNTAAKLLAGIDVLNTFSKHYDLCAPVFCDNRESVSWIPNSKSQIISLFVSPEDKKLRVVPSGKKQLELV